MKTGLRFNWTVMVVFFIIIVTALTSLVNVTFGTKTIRQELVERGRTIANGVATNSEYALFIQNKSILATMIETVLKAPDVVYCGIYDSRGRLFESGTNIEIRIPDTITPQDKNDKSLTNLPFRATNIIDVTIPVYTVQTQKTQASEALLFADETGSAQEQKTSVIGYAKIGLSEKNTTAKIKALNRAVIQISAIVVIFGGLLSVAFVNRMLNPIRMLSQATESIAGGNLAVSVSTDRGDEIGVLARSFEQMTHNLRETTVSRDSLMKEIAERKKTEEALKEQKEKAELAVKTKSQFLANMSHEIRTPLNGVLGFTDLLKNTPLSEVQREYINTIQISGSQLLTLINDILDISKHEAGQIHLESIAFDLGDLLGKAISITEPKTRDREIKFVYDYPENLPRKFNGDPTRIRQIFLNLIGNAAKFTERGEVTVSVGTEPAADSDSDDTCRMRVDIRDTGIGIPRDKLEIIFDAFTQADQSTTRKYGGTGLGLSICKFLVDKMHGSISIHSAENKGTKCSVILPLAKAKSMQARPAPAFAPESGPAAPYPLKPHVLGVRLSKPSCTLIADYCREHGIVFSIVENSSSLPARNLNRNTRMVIIRETSDGNLEQVRVEAAATQDGPLNDARQILILSAAEAEYVNDVHLNEFAIILRQPLTSRTINASLSSIILPTSVPAAAPPPIGDGEVSGRKVLLVEDNAINSQFISILLESLDCRHKDVDDGQEAVDLLRAGEKFDLILMDIQMPVLDGIEATRIIRNELKLDIPIIAISAAAMLGDQEKALQAGINGYVTKPVEIEALKQQMLAWLPKN